MIGAGPAKRESQTLRPYSGLAGDELRQLYLPLAGLHDDEVVLANGSACWDGTDRTPPTKRILSCSTMHLPALIDRVQPVVIVTMGAATQAIVDKRVRLDVHHGRPQYTSVLNGAWEGYVWPSYEPALGMRDTGMMSHLMDDFKHLGQWLRGEWVAPTYDADMEPTDYRIVSDCYYDLQELDAYLHTDARFRGLDTEDHGPDVWSVQISTRPGTGRLIRADNRRGLDVLGRWIATVRPELTMHFALHDIDACHRLGLPEIRCFRDTMQEAYHACSLPQGLKALVYRLFGHEMRSWEDVVWPASIAKMQTWLQDALLIAAESPEQIVEQLKRGHCRDCGHYHSKGACKCGCPIMLLTREKVTYKPNAIQATLAHVLRYCEPDNESEGKPYNPWKKLPEMRESGLRGRSASQSEWGDLMSQVGEMPLLGIGNCDEDEALTYAIADADWTARAAAELEKRRGEGKWTSVSVEDYDE